MATPDRFVLDEPFRHKSPESVRQTVSGAGFVLHTVAGTKDSEIWSKPDGGGGHWIVRIDAQGHSTRFHFGARPHYHKNWVENDVVLAQYLTRYTPGAAIYDDSGALIGTAGAARTDRAAKLQHIPR